MEGELLRPEGHQNSQSKQSATSRSISEPVTESPSAACPSLVKKIRTAVASRNACATCTPSAAAIARHHRRASPSVCGSACASSINGAAQTKQTTSAARTMYSTSNTTATTAQARPRKMRKIPPEATAPTMNCFRLALACPGSTPPERKPKASAFANPISCPDKDSEAFTATAVTPSRCSESLSA